MNYRNFWRVRELGEANFWKKPLQVKLVAVMKQFHPVRSKGEITQISHQNSLQKKITPLFAEIRGSGNSSGILYSSKQIVEWRRVVHSYWQDISSFVGRTSIIANSTFLFAGRTIIYCYVEVWEGRTLLFADHMVSCYWLGVGEGCTHSIWGCSIKCNTCGIRIQTKFLLKVCISIDPWFEDNYSANLPMHVLACQG